MKKYLLIGFCFLSFMTMAQEKSQNKKTMELATFGGGCFWCVEAIFQNLEGVEKVVSGYSGGKTENPTYADICKGFTGHAEVIQLTFDPSKITYKELLEVFFKTHDPTTMNQQGADKGTQYRSIILYHSSAQQQIAQAYIDALDNAEVYKNLVVTEVVQLTKFYPAEQYHQNYYQQNKDKQAYCQYVILPKMNKFEKEFKDKLRKK